MSDEVNKKNILLFSPDSGVLSTELGYLAPPLGVIRLVGYLNSKGHEADYYDPNLYACNAKGPDIEQKILEKDWDIIGFSLTNETLLTDIQNMYLANQLRPEALIIAGGIEAQFNYQTLLDKSPCQIVILGEGEIPLLKLANSEPWESIPGIVVKTNAVALSQELFNEATEQINWEGINYEDYWDVYTKIYKDQWDENIAGQVKTVRVFSRNRCPIGCKYCSSTFQLTLATGGKVPVISATEDTLVETVERIVRAHPETKMIYLTDDDFVINKLSVIRFCKLVIERNFGDLKFMCFARITDLTEEVIRWMSKANFRKLNIGLESFSQNILDEVGKRCDANKIPKVLELLKKYDVRPYCNIILSTPESTLEDTELTLDHVLSYLEDDFYQFGIIPAIYPLRGTEFFENYCNFRSHITPIPGTEFLIRRDDYILSENAQMREFQNRYIEGVDAAVEKFIADQDIRHAHSAALSYFKCTYAKNIVNDIKREWAVDGGVNRDMDDSTSSAGRNYSDLGFSRKGRNSATETEVKKYLFENNAAENLKEEAVTND